MLETSRTQYQLTTNYLVSGDIGVDGIIDGAGLVAVLENGVQKVKVPATASNNDVFKGIAFSQYRAQTTTNKVDSFVVPTGGGSATLSATPIGGVSKVLARVYNADGTSTAAAPQARAPSEAGQVQLVGDVVTFYADDAGKKVEITYSYNISVAELQGLPFMGDGVPGIAVSAATGTISAGLKGNFYTDQYDPSVDWNSVKKEIKVGNNGIFTFGSSAVGASVNGSVCHVPTTDVPFLGIDITVA